MRSEETHKELEMFCAMYPTMSDRAIARMVGVSRTLVWTYRSRRQGKRNPNWEPCRPEKVEAIVLELRSGKTYKEIAASVHCGLSTIAKVALRHGLNRRGSEHTEAKAIKARAIADLLRLGLPYKEIAATVHVSISTIVKVAATQR